MLNKVYSYTSTPSLCLHGRLQCELCLSHGIWLDTLSSFRLLSWHWVTDSSGHVWLWLSVSALLWLIILVGFSLVMGSFLLGLDSVSYFWYLDMRTWRINIMIEYLGHVVLILKIMYLVCKVCWKKDGASLSQDTPWRGPQGGLLYWGTRKMRFLRDMQSAL